MRTILKRMNNIWPHVTGPKLWLNLLLLSMAWVSAHAYYQSSDLPVGAILSSAPAEFTIVFNESLETRVSIFKVYPLDASSSTDEAGSATADASASVIEATELTRLNDIAEPLVDEVLSQRGDEAERADAGIVTANSRTAEVTIKLKEDLEPGHYVVMWRVLGTDGHTTQDYYVFQVRP